MHLVKRSCVAWFVSLVMVRIYPPANVKDGVITLNCNLSQFPMVACLREEENVAIYFKSVADAGLTSGTDPFEQTGPIRF